MCEVSLNIIAAPMIQRCFARLPEWYRPSYLPSSSLSPVPHSHRLSSPSPPQPHEGVIPWKELRADLSRINVSAVIRQYIRDVVVCVRQHNRVQIGPSPTGHDKLVQLATLNALLDGDEFVRPCNVDAVVVEGLVHRVRMRNSSQLSARQMLNHIISSVLSPPK